MLHSYCPEMGEPQPAAEIEATMSSRGADHWYLKTPLVLKGRGITYQSTYTAQTLVPAAHHKIGWHRYKVTERAFQQIVKNYSVSTETTL